MIVLFTGNRGSGKTTVARELYNLLDEAGIRHISQFSFMGEHPGVLKKLWYGCILWFYFNWRLFRVYALSVLRTQGRISMYRLYFPLILSYNLKRLSQGKTDVVVYDTDAISWNIRGIESGVLPEEEMAALYRDVVAPWAGSVLIVRINTPPEVSLVRWRARKDKKSKSRNPEEIIRGREKRKLIMDALLKDMRAVPHVRVIELDGTREPVENAEAILAEIQNET